jgi:hypothetical protein
MLEPAAVPPSPDATIEQREGDKVIVAPPDESFAISRRATGRNERFCFI